MRFICVVLIFVHRKLTATNVSKLKQISHQRANHKVSTSSFRLVATSTYSAIEIYYRRYVELWSDVLREETTNPALHNRSSRAD